MTRWNFLNTRPTGQSSEFSDLLSKDFEQITSLPCLEIVCGEELGDLKNHLSFGEKSSWVVFTSANGVRAVADHSSLPDLASGMSVAAIGEKTCQAIEELGLNVDFSPKQQNSGGFAEEFSGAEGSSLFLLRGDLANKGLVQALEGKGYKVSDLVVYCSVAPDYSNEQLFAALTNLKSSNTVIGLLSGEAARNLKEYAVRVNCWQELSEAATAVIGPVTARAVAAEGYNLAITASRPDVSVLADEIINWVLTQK